MEAPRDVWIGILHHFRISLSQDKAGDIKAKKRTLLNLALTHPKLTDIALDELWRSMSSLMPVVNVLNEGSSASITTALGGAVLQRTYNCWEFVYLSNGDKEYLTSRISPYLARIRSIHLSSCPSQEYMLWYTLSTLEPGVPLCPRLRELSIHVDVGTVAYHIAPLLTSSSLRSVTLRATPYECANDVAASIILDALKFRNVGISDLVYTGRTSSHIILRVMSFSSLVSVAISSGCGGDAMTSAHIASFQKMENLTSLDINLDNYSDDALRDVGEWFETLVSLSSFTLRGSFPEICCCIQDRNPMASVRSFGLHIHALKRLGQDERIARLIPLVFTILPNLCSLHLEVAISSFTRQLAPLTIIDLLSFRERPMQALSLRHCLTLANPSNDLVGIITAWPTLQRLCIESTGEPGSASEVLPCISRCAPSLQYAALPLRFTLPWVASATGEVNCPLQDLRVPWDSPSSVDFFSTLELARSLIELFPRLSTVSALGAKDHGPLQDLQAAIKTLQDVIALPPRRPDRLFR